MTLTSWQQRQAEWIRQACVLEATARKPGNVHPSARYEDLTYEDFLLAAQLSAPILATCTANTVGVTILEAIRATRSQLTTNANLGIVLLLAPLSAVPAEAELRQGIRQILDGLTIADASAVYEAIRVSQPGGLGEASEQDVSTQPTVTLTAAMKLAAHRDLVARQYANGYADAFALADSLREKMREFDGAVIEPTLPLSPFCEDAIIRAFVEFLAHHRDTLIERKCGPETAEEASQRARQVLATASHPLVEDAAFQALDHWLRADGHRRNPGATADLMAAALYVLLREWS